ncbi:MAG: FG-GAP repeat protein [Sandaracinaceae bacterium]|nr:FG-GAP repeat protein [Sandaracinaceae bacterium]
MLVLAALTGCSGEPSLDELNASHPLGDPSVDETPPAAPFEGGQRRDVGDADAVLAFDALPEWIEGVIAPGDLDADGFDDLALLSRRHAPPTVVPCDMGCPAFDQTVVYLIYGRADFGGAIAPSAELVGWYLNDLRHAVAPAGDLDGDGAAELAISVGSVGCDQGNVLLVPGGPRRSGSVDVRDVAALVRESGTCARLGDGVGVGDVDGDGRDDLVLSTPGTDRAYLFYGDGTLPSSRESERDADAVLVGEGVGAARGVGDVSGDGLADFVLGVAPSTVERLSGERRHVLVLGSRARLSGEVALEPAPRVEASVLRGVGDVTGDGLDDLAATVASGPSDLFVIEGRARWPAELDARESAIHLEHAASAPPGEPATVLAAGDVDGDGHDDLLYGVASYASDDGVPRGAVHLFRGPLTDVFGMTRATTFLGRLWRSDLSDVPRGMDEIGRTMAAGLDLNGDGLDDLVLPAPNAPEGRVYVWLGRRS